MALLFIDGFDHMGTTSPATLTKWATAAGPATIAINTSTFRTGTGALSIGTNTSGSITSRTFPASGGAIIGIAFRTQGLGTSDLIQILEGTTIHMVLATTATGQLQVKRGTTVLATGTTTLLTNSFYYLEIKTVIHDTTGSYEVRIDGITEAALTNAGPTDTRNGGTTGQWDTVKFIYPGISSASYFFDDVYFCDTSGSAPTNTFLGSIKVETLLPQTDAVSVGSNTGLTPSTGTDHGALVDENPPNTTDYNSSPTVGVKDTYQYPSMTLSGTIVGIQTNLYIQKSDAVARQVCAVVRTGGTDFDGANVSPATSFMYFSEVRALNPNTGVAWTSSDINALEVGMKVTV